MLGVAGEFLGALHGFGKDGVCAGCQVALAALDALFKALDGAGVAAGDDHKVRVLPRRAGRGDLALHFFRSDQGLAVEVAAALGHDLVL